MKRNPAHGVRVRFDLRRGADDTATYDVTVFDGDETFGLVAALEATSGSVQFELTPSEAPPWIQRSVLAFSKQILAGRRATPPGPWPRRVLRWRAAPSV